MSVVVNFSDEFGRWLVHNLSRGCGIDDVVASMVAQRFEPNLARRMVEAFVHTHSASGQWPDKAVLLDVDASYVYETPRLPDGATIRAVDRDVAVLLRVARPVAALLGPVLSEQECDDLIAQATPRLTPSTVVDPITGKDKVAEHRDSEGMFFALMENELIDRLDRRLSALMDCPVEHGEGLQVLRYGPRAQNTPHYDFLQPGNEANRASLARSGQRISTMVVYLNDVPSGGETVFPEAGLSVTPRKGYAVYFEYANSLRQVDPLSVHAGAPVHEGEKWIVTKWMRERPFVPAGQ